MAAALALPVDLLDESGGAAGAVAGAAPRRLGSASLTRDRRLAVSPLVAPVLPGGCLQRGTTVIVGGRAPNSGSLGASRAAAAPGARGAASASGTTSLALELLAGASGAGGWCAAVGLANLGLVAARERGVVLERLLVVPSPGPSGRWQQVLAALFDGMEMVLFAPQAPVRQGDARKLSARARDRGSVLLVVDKRGWWSEPGDLRCSVASSSWSGLGAGHGLLGARTVEVEVSGRGAAARPRRGAVKLSS